VDQPESYAKFLDILTKFKKKDIEVPQVVNAVCKLFAGKNELILGFNTFLPGKQAIGLQEIENYQKSNKKSTGYSSDQSDMKIRSTHKREKQVRPPLSFQSINVRVSRPEKKVSYARTSERTEDSTGKQVKWAHPLDSDMMNCGTNQTMQESPQVQELTAEDNSATTRSTTSHPNLPKKGSTNPSVNTSNLAKKDLTDPSVNTSQEAHHNHQDQVVTVENTAKSPTTSVSSPSEEANLNCMDKRSKPYQSVRDQVALESRVLFLERELEAARESSKEQEKTARKQQEMLTTILNMQTARESTMQEKLKELEQSIVDTRMEPIVAEATPSSRNEWAGSPHRRTQNRRRDDAIDGLLCLCTPPCCIPR